MARQMKNSGVEWIGKIPDNVGILKAKYLFSFQKGKLPTSVNNDGRGLPCIGASEMNGAEPSNYTEDNLPTCHKSDVLLLWDGANAGLVSTGHEGIVASTVCRVRLTSNLCFPRFAYYTLKNAERYYRDKVGGTTIPHMNPSYINDTLIVNFDYQEQQRISAFLDKKCSAIDDVLAKTQESIEEYKKLKQAVITEAVTKGVRGKRPMKDSGVPWFGKVPVDVSISKIGRHYDIILGKMLCDAPKSDNMRRIPYICAANVHFDGVDTSELKQMWFTPDEIELYQVVDGDLLIVEGGAGAGGCAIAHNIEGVVGIQNSIQIIRSKDNADNRFLCYALQSLVKSGYMDVACNKATLPHYTKDKLSNTPYLVWSKEEQQEIADYLDKKCAAIDNLISKKQQFIEELTAYKKSLIYEYVTGKKEVPA